MTRRAVQRLWKRIAAQVGVNQPNGVTSRQFPMTASLRPQAEQRAMLCQRAASDHEHLFEDLDDGTDDDTSRRKRCL
jgi:hypothetical protein